MKSFGPNLAPLIFFTMNWCKIKFEYRKDRIREGCAPLRLVIIISGKKLRKTLGVLVPVANWDSNSMNLKGNSKEINELRLIIEATYNNAYNALKEMHIANTPKTVDEFLNRFEDRVERLCFLRFMEEQSEERLYHGEISDGTYSHCKVVVNKIKSFIKTNYLAFDTMTPEWLRNFERYDIKDIKSKKDVPPLTVQNTVANHLKKIKAYVKIARVKGVIKANPFEGYKIRQVETQRDYLSEKDFIKLVALFREKFYEPGSSLDGVLRNFLLMCCTGMRVSDLQNFRRSFIKENEIVFIPIKTMSNNKQVRIPLNNLSRELIATFQGDFIRYKIANQTQNNLLKKIAIQADLDLKKLTNHIGRHTFSTLFIKKGGKVEMLQSLLAHSSINTTMKYVHLFDEDKKKQVEHTFEGY